MQSLNRYILSPKASKERNPELRKSSCVGLSYAEECLGLGFRVYMLGFRAEGLGTRISVFGWSL